MITKQQALEFIYELSKLHVVHLDIPCGYAYIDKEEYEYRAWADEHTLEALVTEIIKDNMGNALLMNFNKIPVDVDMLEVGQTYEIEYDNYGEIDKIVDKLTKITIDEYRNNCRTLHFDRYRSITEGLIIEIYKVNEQ